ncbi:MAG TPA: hypothetical protein VHX14_20400 [Thermoanaerobaculia bacterium]|nr:hypothetical protein [Thermoanaerobaculia bacterium]
MKKIMIVAVLAAVVAIPTFAASYWVVLKDGTRYEAKSKWTVVNGKAVVNLVNGSVLNLDPNAINVAKSEEMTRLGGGDLFGVEQIPAPSTTKASQLGTTIKLRKLPPSGPAAAAAAPAEATIPIAPGALLGSDVLGKFERAYENVGIFEHKLVATGPHSLRADLTADTEDKVFNTLSATAFLMVRNAGVTGVQIDYADIFMKTTTGAAAGRFHLTHDEAQAIESKAITPQSYFVQKVLF